MTESHLSPQSAIRLNELTVLFHQYVSFPDGHITPVHTHPFWQCELLIRGSCQVHYGRNTFLLPAGRLLLIPPGQVHGFSCQPSTIVSIKFETSLSGGGLVRDDAMSQALAHTIAAIGSDSHEPEEHRHRLLEGPLCSALHHHHRDRKIHQPDDLASLVDEQCDHLGDRNIHLADLAQRLGMSPGHLANRWRAEVGGSIKVHLDRRRARRAAHLLRYSDASIQEISQVLAFTECSAFSRFFKRLTGKSPRDIRARWKTE